jgi:hypothetical protein
MIFNILIFIKYTEVKKLNNILKNHFLFREQENEELNKMISVYTESNEIALDDEVILKNDVFYLFISRTSCFSCLEKSLWAIKGFLKDINQDIVIISSGWNVKLIDDWILLNGEGYFSVLDSSEFELSFPKLVYSISPCFFKVNENTIRLIHKLNSKHIEKTKLYLQRYLVVTDNSSGQL